MSGGVRTPSAEEQAMKRALRATLEDDRALLMAAQPFTAMLAMQLAFVPVADSRLPVAATDGRHVFFNVHACRARSAPDRRFILAHEVWHCVLGHFRRKIGREPRRWNIAVDYEVNHLLAAELGHCPADALYDEALIGLNAEEIYQRLSDDADSRADGSDRVWPRHGQRVLDTHDLSGHDGADADNDEADTGEFVIDPDYCPQPPLTQSEEQALREVWRQRLVATAQQRKRDHGTLPGHLRRIIETVRTPRVHWRQLLARFVLQRHGGNRQWLPPARRHVHRGLYLPSRRAAHLSLTLALDNSGSCHHDIPDFVAELSGLLSAFDTLELRLLVFDTSIREERTLTEQSLHELRRFELHGGGGTDFRPVFSRCDADPPDLLLLLTDGYGPAPTTRPTYPVIWTVTADGHCPVDWGETITLDA